MDKNTFKEAFLRWEGLAEQINREIEEDREWASGAVWPNSKNIKAVGGIIMCDKKPIFEVGKTYKNRGGEDVRIICNDAKGKYPIVGLRLDVDGYEYAMRFRVSGLYGYEENSYFENFHLVLPVKKVWVNFYEDGTAQCYPDERLARCVLELDKRFIAKAVPVEMPE